MPVPGPQQRAFALALDSIALVLDFVIHSGRSEVCRALERLMVIVATSALISS